MIEASTEAIAPLSSRQEAAPLYRQVRQALLDWIASGRLKPGEPLPAERELAQRFAVSIGTLRKAIDELVAERLLLRQQGRGTFVAVHDRRRLLYHFFHIVPQDGEKSYPHVKCLSFRRALADTETARRLRLSDGAPVWAIRNSLSLTGRIVLIDEIRIEQARFPDLTAKLFKKRPGTIYQLYQERFAITVARTEERLRAEPASAEHAALLGLTAGAPVLSVRRVAIDVREEPVEWRISYVDTRQHEYFAERL